MSQSSGSLCVIFFLIFHTEADAYSVCANAMLLTRNSWPKRQVHQNFTTALYLPSILLLTRGDRSEYWKYWKNENKDFLKMIVSSTTENFEIGNSKTVNLKIVDLKIEDLEAVNLKTVNLKNQMNLNLTIVNIEKCLKNLELWDQVGEDLMVD